MQFILSIFLSVFFVGFTDKGISPRVALSDTALAMRSANAVAIDSLDYAVSAAYLDSIRAAGGSILHTSRWMNGATVKADDTTAQRIANLSCVRMVQLTRDTTDPSSTRLQRRDKRAVTMTTTDYGLAQAQLQTYNLLPLHEAGFYGQGIRIAVIDGGFQNANTLPALDAVREQILGYYDFTDDSDDFFGTTGSHGTMCLSTMAARMENYEGAATQAQYYLMRTEEYYTESPKELDNWVAAVEAADSMGVHITSTSLGYSTFDNADFDFTYADMNGTGNRASQAATIAARKGMLVVVAAGNEGNKPWTYICAPADADSILTVGAVNTDGDIGRFSSYGPSYDGRVKPEVCAVGWGTTIISPVTGNTIAGNGTSFACPLLAGMAACLWSALPAESAMQIRERIIRSADRYHNPDAHYGYGIPNAWTAYTETTDMQTPSAQRQTQPRKILQDGHLSIIIDGRTYTIMGQKKAN